MPLWWETVKDLVMAKEKSGEGEKSGEDENKKTSDEKGRDAEPPSNNIHGVYGVVVTETPPKPDTTTPTPK